MLVPGLFGLGAGIDIPAGEKAYVVKEYVHAAWRT